MTLLPARGPGESGISGHTFPRLALAGQRWARFTPEEDGQPLPSSDLPTLRCRCFLAPRRGPQDMVWEQRLSPAHVLLVSGVCGSPTVGGWAVLDLRGLHWEAGGWGLSRGLLQMEPCAPKSIR